MQGTLSMLLKTLVSFLPVSLSTLDSEHDNTPAVKSPLSTTSIPDYALEYAPLVWLYSEDAYRPSDIGQQLNHTIPMVNWTAVAGAPSPLTLDNVAALNEHGNGSVFLTSKRGIDASPPSKWLFGIEPDHQGRVDGVSSAIVTRDVGDGVVDVFYFYFYAYNQGNMVLGIGMEFGDHIGDWEHNMIRFKYGKPQAIWYSQHASGQAFTYDATKKDGKRPYAYSGNGTHAVYSSAGTHDHTIPGLDLPTGLLVDVTNEGVLWDPTLNAYAYSYDASTATFDPYDASFPVSWLSFNGHWGDDALPGGPELFGQAKYTAGPVGPQFKGLVREEVCPSKPCVVWPFRTLDEHELEGQDGS